MKDAADQGSRVSDIQVIVRLLIFYPV